MSNASPPVKIRRATSGTVPLNEGNRLSRRWICRHPLWRSSMRIARLCLFILTVLTLTACPKKGGYLRAEARPVTGHPVGTAP